MLRIEPLEKRCLMSVSAVMTEGGILRITGTDGADGVSVINPVAWGLPDTGIQVFVDAADGTGGVLIGEFPGVRAVHARMLGGNDALDCGWVDSPFASDGSKLPVQGISIVAEGGDGDDTIWGSGGNDILIGGAGNDLLTEYGGDESNDVLIGGNGNDILIVYDGDNILIGGNGDDFLCGGSGSDHLIGGSGDDVIS